MLKGNESILIIDGVKLASNRSLTVDRTTDTIEVCSPVDGPARKYIPSTTGWSMSAGGLYAKKEDAERLREIWRKYQRGEHTSLSVKYITADGAEVGHAILTNLQETGNLNELVQFSISLQGSGVLRPSEVRKIDLTFDVDDTHIYFNDTGLHIVDDEDDQVDSATFTIEHPSTVRLLKRIDGGWMILPGNTWSWSQDIYNRREDGIEPYIVASGNFEGSVLLAPGTYSIFACDYEGKIYIEVTE